MATIPANNNTGLYNTSGTPATTSNDITVTGNVNANNVNATSSVNAGTTITAQGNITSVSGYFIGNGSLLTGVVSANATYANTAGHAVTSNTVVDAAQPAITSVGTLTSLTASGNITGSYFLGNGSQLTGLPATYSNAQVASYLASGTNTSNIITTGNVSGTYILGDGSQLTGLPATYGNANVSAYLASGTNTQDIITTATVTGSGLTTSGTGGNITGANNISASNFLGNTANITGNVAVGSIFTDGYYYANGTPFAGGGGTYGDANVTTLLAALGSNVISSTANITTTANVSGAYVIGNGSALTSLTGANVTGTVPLATAATTAGTVTTAAQPNITSVGTLTSLGVTGNITSSANISGSYILGNGSQLTGLPATYTDANVNTHLAAFGSNTISTTGNITAGYFLGNGSQLTGIVSSYGDSNVAAFLPTYTGNVNGGNLNITNNAQIDNDLTVTGTIYGTFSGNIAGNLVVPGSNTQVIYNDNGNAGASNNFRFASDTNILTVTGNVTATQFNGSGVGLTAIPGANVTGTVPVANAATYAGTVTTAAQPNITSLGTLTSLATTGNIDIGGNLLMNGRLYDTSGVFQVDAVGNIVLAPTGSVVTAANIVAGGILTDGYYYANGTPVTFGGTYGDSNVNTLLASWGSNTLSTTGNVTVGNLNMTGQVFDSSGVLQLNAAGNIVMAPTGSLQINGPTDIIGGKLTTGAVTYANTDGTTGQVLTTYGNGVTYFSTVSGGGSPGGSDTQIQFNDGGSFAGNANMTFSKTTGNIGLGNIVINAQQIQTVANANVGLSTSINPNPGRVFFGAGYNGNISAAFDTSNMVKTGRLVTADTYNVSDGNTQIRQFGASSYYNLTANITGTNSRLSGGFSGCYVGGGASANTISGQLTSVSGFVAGPVIGGGTSGNLTSLGNTTAQYTLGLLSIPQISSGSTGGNVHGVLSFVNNAGTANTAIGYSIDYQGAGTFGNTYGVYMPGATNNHGYTNSNNARNANYYFLKNEDNHSKSQVGQLTTYQESEYALASSSGAVAVDKSNGQVQFFTVSEDATMSFSNFIVSSTVSATTRYMTDTVTVIVQQDATGRTITLPTPDATYKYAAGNNSVPATADSVSMISVTAIYNSVTAATQYLITISPEFS